MSAGDELQVRLSAGKREATALSLSNTHRMHTEQNNDYTHP